MRARLVRHLPPALLVGLLLAGCTLPYGSHPSAPLPAEPGEMERDAYVIGHGDILKIVVWKNPELSVEAVPVRPDGKIGVPLLNDVQASGLTPDELKELLTRSFAEYVQNPDVTVVVTQILSKRVHILGQVARSGAVPLTQDMRVLDAISAAGGFAPFADKDDIKILRRSEGGIVEYHFDYDAFMRGRGAEGNMLLMPGDTIVVPE